MNDRNKTSLTHDVTSAVALAMDVWGFKPVETEVPMPWTEVNVKGWIADLAGVICPTQTELIDLKLIPKRPPYYAKGTGEYTEKYLAWKEAYASVNRMMTCLVEVKTSRSDYCGDRKWTMVHSTDLAYVAFPKGLVREEEWPVGWGILEYSEGVIRRLRPPTPRQASVKHQLDIVLNIAIRRDHHTRYERHREFQKKQRLEDSKERPLRRIYEVARAVVGITHGRYSSFDMAIKCFRLDNMPDYLREELRELWNTAPKERQGEFEN